MFAVACIMNSRPPKMTIVRGPSEATIDQKKLRPNHDAHSDDIYNGSSIEGNIVHWPLKHNFCSTSCKFQTKCQNKLGHGIQ